jgi:hypothetical protein
MPMLLNKLKNLGITTIMDLDDYWAPGPHHPAYLIIKNSKMDEKIIGNLKIAENITTTTDIFAKEIANELDKEIIQKMILAGYDDKIFALKVSLKEVD